MITRGRGSIHVVTLVVAAVATACFPGPGSPGTHRGPVSLAGQQAYLVAPAVMQLEVPSCNGDPVVAELVEEGEQVRIQVVTTVSNPGDACLDGIRVQLEAPLGDRELIDIPSGDPIRVQDAPGH